MSRRARFGAALATLALYLGFVVAWRSDKPAVIAPPDSAISTSVRADLYARLAAGFLKGQLHLDIAVPPELVAAKNPYDPAERPGVIYLHDASVYRGRYYIYFGPAPAVLLYVPWRLITGHDLPTPNAVFIFVSLAYAGLLTFFAAIVRTYYASASRRAEWAGIAALSGATMLVPLLRRPGVYEAAISCGCACLIWGLYCAWRARTADRPLRWATVCGLLFGLAVAARPTFGLGALAAALIMGIDPITQRFRWRIDRRLVAAAAAGAGPMIALLAYNFARFHDPLQFGQSYQLTAAGELTARHFSASFVAPQAWFYLVSPLRLSGYFPFIRDVALPQMPAGFAGHEYSFGVFSNLPFTWFAIAALLTAWRGAAARALILSLTAASVLALAPLLLFFGSCVRYQAEFTPALILVAACGVLEAEAMAGGRRRLVATLALALALISGVVAVLASVDMYNASENIPPRGFDAIGRLLNKPVVAWEQARGRLDGPVELTLRLEPGNAQRERLVRVIGPAGASETVSIERAGPGKIQLIAQRTGPEPFDYTAMVDADGDDVHRLTVSMGSLYPLRPIELSRPIRREDFRALQIWLRVGWDGRPIIEQAVPAITWRAAQTLIGGGPPSVADAGGRWAEVISHRRTPLPSSTRPRTVTGVRISVRFDPSMEGHSYPLAVTGHQGQGDFLFVKVTHSNKVQFGYDHWAKPMLLSTPVAITGPGRHTIEFWMPSILSADEPSTLVIRLDGQTAWSAAVPFYPAGAQEIFVGRNPLGGSSCERDFPGLTVESFQLPRP